MLGWTITDFSQTPAHFGGGFSLASPTLWESFLELHHLPRLWESLRSLDHPATVGVLPS